MLSKYICALDISSSKISAVVAQIRNRRILNIFFEYMPSRGIKRGIIVDAMALVSCIEGALKNLRAKSGINIKFIYANISGADIVTKHSQAIIALAERGNKVITSSDIRKVNKQARILGSNLDEEIIHAIPFSYALDAKENIIDPIGLYSHKLEADLYLICAKLSSIQSLSRTVNQAGYEIKNLFFPGIASSSVVFGKEIKHGVNILCDIGSDITELLVFSDGMLKDVEILPIGGDNLTEQLSEALSIPFALAEDVKRSHANIGDYKQVKEDEEILIKKDNNYKTIKLKMVSELLTTEAKSICTNIRNAVEKITPADKVDNFVAIGRTVLLEGFLETLENSLGISVRLGQITNQEIAPLVNRNESLSGQRYLTYINPLGSIYQALHEEYPWATSDLKPIRNPFIRAINRFKEIYQEYF